MADSSRILNLVKLKQGFPGVTSALGEACFEACMICFESQHHSSGVELRLAGSFVGSFQILWNEETTDQMGRAWYDEREATEFAASGVAFLLIMELTQYTVLQRSRQGTGYDYWLAEKAEVDRYPFRYAARLEVSGIRRAEKESMIKTRVQQKLDQIKPADISLQTYIIVVEFSRPLAYVVEK